MILPAEPPDPQEVPSLTSPRQPLPLVDAAECEPGLEFGSWSEWLRRETWHLIIEVWTLAPLVTSHATSESRFPRL